MTGGPRRRAARVAAAGLPRPGPLTLQAAADHALSHGAPWAYQMSETGWVSVFGNRDVELQGNKTKYHEFRDERSTIHTYSLSTSNIQF